MALWAAGRGLYLQAIHGAQFGLTLPRPAGHTLADSPLPLVPGESVDEEAQ